MQTDPKADKYGSWSPYNYGFNDPVYWNDPFGDDASDPGRGSNWYNYRRNAEGQVEYQDASNGMYGDYATYGGGFAMYGIGAGSTQQATVSAVQGQQYAMAWVNAAWGFSVGNAGVSYNVSFSTYATSAYQGEAGNMMGNEEGTKFLERGVGREEANIILANLNPVNGAPTSILPIYGDSQRALYWAGKGDWSRTAIYGASAASDVLGLSALLRAAVKTGAKLLAKNATKTEGRAFFSGAGTEARAIEQGYQTLGQTRAGRNLQNLIDNKNIPWSQAEPMWQRLSATWAKGIPNGSSVPVFLNNPRAGSVWFQTELPILQSKGVNLIYK